tara:strand:- start:548 stop:1057 length:510 start_codon:yes stop_codon:yes gene_type:complete
MKKFIAVLITLFTVGVQAEMENSEEYIQQSYAGLQALTEAHKSWGLGSEVNWGVDMNTGKISFIFADGKKAEADVQIIGTYSPNGTFMWGWDHPSVKGNLGSNAALLKEFGEKHKLHELTDQPSKISEQRAWEYTSLAVRLAETNGAYRANAGGGTLVYMTFGEIKLSK